eukprot:jgi/Mesen1/4461/ME000227S03475
MLLIPLCVLLSIEVFILLLCLAPVSILRKAGMAAANMFKGTVGSVVARTLAGSLVVLLIFSVYNIQQVKRRLATSLSNYGANSNNAADQHELLGSILEASMIAYSLVSALVIQQLHNYMRSSDLLKINVSMLKKQAKGLETEYLRLQSQSTDGGTTNSSNSQSAVLKERIDELKSDNERLQEEAEAKAKEAKTAQANVQAIKKQTEGLRIEFDRLLDDNDSLRAQLAQFDTKYSKSDDKKRS